MSAPPNRLAQLLGNLLPKVAADPTLAPYGKGVGFAFDLARSAPPQFWHTTPGMDPEQVADDPAHGLHEVDFRKR